MNLIESKNLSLSYSNISILNNINLNVNKGDFILITGKSGSGKSTLLKSLYGTIKPSNGLLNISGTNMRNISDEKLQKFRKNLGIIFQNYRLINEWTVEENIILPLDISGFSYSVKHNQVNKLLKHVKLYNKNKKYPLELSGGEQQRVGVARALSRNPYLILADEPTGNLDDYSSSVIWKLLENASIQLKTTLIIVTHKIPILNIKYKHFVIEGMGMYEVS